jgi:hypothetical protein
MDAKTRRIALTLGLLGAVGPFAIDMYLPSLPQIAADLGTSVAATQRTLTSYFLVFGIAQLVYGACRCMPACRSSYWARSAASSRRRSGGSWRPGRCRGWARRC